ncbi:MAG: DUF1657 domain-containing protein [Bacillota bacterium]|nr:DUF1657 domain-containing protein [Bacillota bacterium]
MTVGKKLNEVLGSLQTAAGQMRTFALETDNAQAKQMFTNSCQQLDQIISNLASRIGAVESEEPQYRMSSMVQSAVQKDQAQQQLQQQQTRPEDE